MARKVVFGGFRSHLPTAPGKNKRAYRTSGCDTAGNKRGYERLNGGKSCNPPEQVPQLKKLGGKEEQKGRESPGRSKCGAQTPTLVAQSPSRPKQATQLPDRRQMKRKSKLQSLITRVRESYGRLMEAARQSNLQLSDLFAGNQMLVHVTATPVSRSKTVKTSPSPGLGRPSMPIGERSSSFRER